MAKAKYLFDIRVHDFKVVPIERISKTAGQKPIILIYKSPSSRGIKKIFMISIKETVAKAVIIDMRVHDLNPLLAEWKWKGKIKNKSQ